LVLTVVGHPSSVSGGDERGFLGKIVEEVHQSEQPLQRLLQITLGTAAIDKHGDL
jgi:hypothetical protein